MGWSVGWEAETGRWRGYGVPATCEEPGCDEKIDRGLSYRCGADCGRFFCEQHLSLVLAPAEAEDPAYSAGDDEEDLFNLCARCLVGEAPYPLKPEHPMWLAHVLNDDSWAQWRSEAPELVAAYTEALNAAQ